MHCNTKFQATLQLCKMFCLFFIVAVVLVIAVVLNCIKYSRSWEKHFTLYLCVKLFCKFKYA